MLWSHCVTGGRDCSTLFSWVQLIHLLLWCVLNTTRPHAHKSILTITNNTLQKKILTWMTPKHKTIYLIILQILVMKKIASFRIIETEQDNQWWTSLSVRLWLWVGGENLWCQWPLEVDSWWPGPHGHWCHWCHDTYSLVVTLLHQPSHSISMHV